MCLLGIDRAAPMATGQALRGFHAWSLHAPVFFFLASDSPVGLTSVLKVSHHHHSIATRL